MCSVDRPTAKTWFLCENCSFIMQSASPCGLVGHLGQTPVARGALIRLKDGVHFRGIGRGYPHGT